jgi:hypothetical protein
MQVKPMSPWLWYWSPVIHFPWSGNLAQDIEPYTNWFSSLIPPKAGDAAIEKQAFAVASYGRQLGLITEVLLDLAAKSDISTPEARTALGDLKDIKVEIDALKTQEYGLRAEQLLAEVERFSQRGGNEYVALAQKLRELLG